MGWDEIGWNMMGWDGRGRDKLTAGDTRDNSMSPVRQDTIILPRFCPLLTGRCAEEERVPGNSLRCTALAPRGEKSEFAYRGAEVGQCIIHICDLILPVVLGSVVPCIPIVEVCWDLLRWQQISCIPA